MHVCLNETDKWKTGTDMRQPYQHATNHEKHAMKYCSVNIDAFTMHNVETEVYIILDQKLNTSKPHENGPYSYRTCF